MNEQAKLYIGLIAVTLLLFGGLLYIGSREQNKPAESGAAYSTAFAAEAKVMYFYSDACSYCVLQKPILDELAQEGYRVKPMDVAADGSLWRQYNVKGTPTFLTEGGGRLVGFQEKDDLRLFLDTHGGKTITP